MNGSKKLLVLAGCGVVGFVAAATVNHFSNDVNLDQAKVIYHQGVAAFNDWSAANSVAITAVNRSLEESGSEQLNAITRFYTPNKQKNTRNCIDVATNLTLTFGLFNGDEVATTHSTVVADPEKTDCLWVSEIQKSPKGKAFFDSVLQGEVPAELDSTHSLDGASAVTLVTRAVQAKDIDTKNGSEKMSLDIHPLKLELDVPAARDSVTYRFDWPGMELGSTDMERAGASGKLSVGTISAQGESAKITDNIWVGPGEFSFSQIKLAVPSGNKVEHMAMDGLKLISSAKTDQGRLSQGIGLSVADIRINGQSYGQFEYGITMNDVDIASLDRFFQVMQEVAQTGAMKSLGNQATIPALNAQQQESLMNALIQAANQASFSIEPLSYRVGEGHITSSLKVDVHDVDKVTMQSLQKNPAELAGKLTVKFDGSFNDRLFKQIGALELLPLEHRKQIVSEATKNSQMGVQLGLLQSEKEGVYKIHFSFDRGQAELNGKPVDPQMMQALMAPE